MIALTIGLAVFVGISLGLLGGGGSILTVPLLAYVAGLDAKQAIATSLLVVGVTSAFGAIAHASLSGGAGNDRVNLYGYDSGYSSFQASSLEGGEGDDLTSGRTLVNCGAIYVRLRTQFSSVLSVMFMFCLSSQCVIEQHILIQCLRPKCNGSFHRRNIRSRQKS